MPSVRRIISVCIACVLNGASTISFYVVFLVFLIWFPMFSSLVISHALELLSGIIGVRHAYLLYWYSINARYFERFVTCFLLYRCFFLYFEFRMNHVINFWLITLLYEWMRVRRNLNYVEFMRCAFLLLYLCFFNVYCNWWGN